MDDLDLSPGETPAKKLRKTAAVRRPRTRTAEAEPVAADSSAVSPATDATPEVTSPVSVGENAAPGKRVRTRRSKAPSASADESYAPELFVASPSAAPTPLVYSFSPDAEPADSQGPADLAAPAVRPVFVPDGMAAVSDDAAPLPVAAPSDAGPAVPGEGAPHGQGGDSGGPGVARREDRKSWWERKKEKKRQKWLERQAGGGGGGNVHGPQGGGGGGRDRGERLDRPERNPAQPLPPSLQAPVGTLPSDERLADQAALDALADTLAQDAAPLDLTALHAANAAELAQRLRDLGEPVLGMPPRRSLVEQLFAWSAREKRALSETGVLDLFDAGHGFIVHRVNSYRLYPESTYVPATLVRRHGLRRGQEVSVLAQPPKPGERCPAAVRVLSVMGTTPEQAREVTAFEELTPYYPTARILVEAPEIHKDISMRAVDLLTPIGFGQRGLIVAPPRTGKTVLLQNIANSITHNYPEATLLLLLIDERPEEVTDFRRHTKGEVVSSTFDETPESHAHAAEMVIERARRLVEMGKHVVILLDSITRLARAYNALAGNGGKTMSGGIESNALQRPKRFFGSARNIEGGGSLTILATALIDTNSRMDEVIFEEFKGTGNMELHLDRGLSDKRIFPAINIDRSGTRKEELIYHPDEMLRVYGLRRAMQGIPPVEAMDMFIQRLKKTRTNTEFLLSLNR
jgi:transcription termination factor Rho